METYYIDGGEARFNDTQEFENSASFPEEGTESIVYIDKETNKIYRRDSSVGIYMEVSGNHITNDTSLSGFKVGQNAELGNNEGAIKAYTFTGQNISELVRFTDLSTDGTKGIMKLFASGGTGNVLNITKQDGGGAMLSLYKTGSYTGAMLIAQGNVIIDNDGKLKAVASEPEGITGASAISNMVSISQADYDAIATPDPSTLYIITG